MVLDCRKDFTEEQVIENKLVLKWLIFLTTEIKWTDKTIWFEIVLCSTVGLIIQKTEKAVY